MLRLRVLIAVLSTICSVSAFAAGEPVAKPDPRLEQKVTYEAKNLQVRKILDELSEKTGVQMIAGGSAKDWQVRDRRMNLFVNDVSLAEVQKSISALMHFRWSRGGEEGKWHYRLWQDKKSLTDEENKRIKAEEARDRAEKQRRQEALDALGNLDNLTPDQIEKLKQDNPYLYIAAKSGVGQGLKQFFGSAPGVRDSLMSGQEGKMKVSDLSPAAQQGLTNSLQSIVKMMGGRDVDGIQKLLGNMSNATIELNNSKRFLAGTPMAGQILGDMSIRAEGGGNFDLPFMDPNSNVAKAMGRFIMKIMDGADPQQAGQGMQSEMMLAMAADMAKEASALAEKEEPKPDDPELDKKIALKLEPGKKLDVTLADFIKASSMNIVSDSFAGTSFGVVKIDEKEIAIKDALDKITKGYNCSWTKEGAIIRVQHKDWYRKRAAQIPDEWIDAWAETLKTTGTLDIDDLAAIASLSDEQINMNLRDSQDAVKAVGMSIMGSRDILKFYGSLDNGQITALSDEEGLSAHMLTPEQWALIQGQIRSKNAALLPDPPIPLIVKMSKSSIEKRFMYKFTVSSPESDQTAVWDVLTPQYKAKEEKAQPPVNPEKKP